MQGQATWFKRWAPDTPYAIERYNTEIKRLYGVLQIRLGDGNRDWLAGSGRGKYTMADVNAWPWVRCHPYAGIETLDPWPAVKAWVERIAARPSAQTGPTIPKDLNLNRKWSATEKAK